MTSLQHRIGLIPGVQLDAAVVGIDDSLDRVPHVVDVVLWLGHHGPAGAGLSVGRDLIEVHRSLFG